MTDSDEQYLTYKEICGRLHVSRRSIKRKIAAGIWRAGTHYVNPPGMHIRFCWTAIQRWMATQASPKKRAVAPDLSVDPATQRPPHFRSYTLTS